MPWVLTARTRYLPLSPLGWHRLPVSDSQQQKLKHKSTKIPSRPVPLAGPNNGAGDEAGFKIGSLGTIVQHQNRQCDAELVNCEWIVQVQTLYALWNASWDIKRCAPTNRRPPPAFKRWLL
jgi:hypothetical protein